MNQTSDLRLIPCDLCASEDIAELSRRARDGRRLRTTICRGCGLVWANPPPSPRTLRQYYSHEYRRESKGTPFRTVSQTYRAGVGAIARYQAIHPLLTPGGAVLDVGSGGGELVYLLRHLGFEAEGLEPDKAYSEAARTSLGVPVRTGFVEDVDYPIGGFHAVFMYHALEHMARPVSVLARVRSWMTGVGVLVVEVPNIEAQSEAPMTRFHVDHLYYFNPDTLQAVGRAAGFYVRDVTLSLDGGTITAVFCPQPTGNPPRESAGAYQQIVHMLRTHTNRRYYCSATPYRRMRSRLVSHWRTRTITKQFTNARQVLDALFRETTRHSSV